MKRKILNFCRNVSYSLVANLVQMLTYASIVLIVPKVIAPEQYAYFQLYLFYIAYLGFFHFGLIDGLYLKLGGADYSDLDKEVLKSQLKILLMLLIILVPVVTGVLNIGNNDDNKTVVFFSLGLCAFAYIPFTFFQYVSQISCRISNYARGVLIQQIFYFILVLIMICTRKNNFMLYIASDILSKIIGLTYLCWVYSDILFSKSVKLGAAIKIAWDNIKVGIKLLIANIASLFIVGVIRIAIEHGWDVVTFGRVSLVISLCNSILTFVTAISLVLFPMFRRIKEINLKKGFVSLDFLITSLFICLMIFYQPMKQILITWLPEYEDSILFLGILLPICLFESKMMLLLSTYLKVFRNERLLLIINLGTCVLSCFLAFVSTMVVHNLSLAVMVIVIVLASRCICAETLLARQMGVHVVKLIIEECLVVLAFIIINYCFSGVRAMLIYMFICFLYFVFNVRWLKDALKNIKLFFE